MGLAVWQSKVISRIKHTETEIVLDSGNRASRARILFAARDKITLVARNGVDAYLWKAAGMKGLRGHSFREPARPWISRFHQGARRSRDRSRPASRWNAKGEVSPRGFSHTILPELTAPSVWKGIIYWKGEKRVDRWFSIQLL